MKKLYLAVAVYKSCKEIFDINPSATDGVYQLEDGPHHCIMDSIPGCGVGGWTLAMKIDGTKVCFFYLIPWFDIVIQRFCLYDLCVR